MSESSTPKRLVLLLTAVVVPLSVVVLAAIALSRSLGGDAVLAESPAAAVAFPIAPGSAKGASNAGQ